MHRSGRRFVRTWPFLPRLRWSDFARSARRARIEAVLFREPARRQLRGRNRASVSARAPMQRTPRRHRRGVDPVVLSEGTDARWEQPREAWVRVWPRGVRALGDWLRGLAVFGAREWWGASPPVG